MTGEEAIQFLLEIIDMPGTGSSGWRDPDGVDHCTDMGYVYAFLADVKDYADKAGGLDAMRERYRQKYPDIVRKRPDMVQ